MLRGMAGRRLHVLRFLEPFRQRRVREQASAERARIHAPDTLCLQIGNGFIRKARVLQGVLIVTQDAIHVRLVANEAENLLRVTAEANEAHLALLVEFLRRAGNRFIHDLLHGNKFDVVAEDDIQVIRAQAMQAHVHALRDSSGTEIEVLQIISAQFGAERVAVPRDVAQGDAQAALRSCPAHKRARYQ